MQIVKLLLILIGLTTAVSALAQTNPSVITSDSTRQNNTTKERVDSIAATADTIHPPRRRLRSATAVKPVSAKDTVVKDSARLALEKLPRKAVIRSMILPGLGQIQNRRWWKVPIIYGGFVTLGLAIEFNNRYYHTFLEEAQYRYTHNREPKNPEYAIYSYEGIIRAKDFYRRNRDLSILGAVALYGVQIVDAYVDAKFFRFDISDQLSLKITPSFQPVPQPHAYAALPAIKLKLSL